ncbi:hypothetical protein [Clostridioides difficile]|uniref:hypothetical protein n=1 Tax=Clostridioides difficile TaxID=1496 RepID=UPI0010350A80|nr:hypothetical protein [Clostridioides difficile]
MKGSLLGTVQGLLKGKNKKRIFIISIMAISPSCFLFLHNLIRILGFENIEKEILVIFEIIIFVFITIKISNDCKKNIDDDKEEKLKHI